jgi:uncharacterized protein YndB with AHSA1/START domain
MSANGRGYAHRIDVPATPQLLWRALTESPLLSLWQAPGAEVDARAGGRYLLHSEYGTDREAHIDVFDPPRRLRLIYLTLDGQALGDAVIVDDFLIDARGDSSIVRLLGSGIPEERDWDARYLQWRQGWGRALLRLRRAVIERKLTDKLSA